MTKKTGAYRGERGPRRLVHRNCCREFRRYTRAVRLSKSEATTLGLTRAISEVSLGASWQRYRVRFLRNLLVLVPKDTQGVVLASTRLIFQQPGQKRASCELLTLSDRLEGRLPQPRTFSQKRKRRSLLTTMTYETKTAVAPLDSTPSSRVGVSTPFGQTGEEE